jgi:hypothetical protein
MFRRGDLSGAIFYVWRSASIADPRVIEIAREGQQGSHQDVCCLRALHGGQRRDIVRQRPPMRL